MTTIRSEVTGRKGSGGRRNSDGKRLVYTAPEAGRILGLGRNAAYDAARRGDIPTLRIGRLVLVPKIPFHRMLGINVTVSTIGSEKEASTLSAEPEEAAEGQGKP